MAIDRAWWNALVDDDGSGNTGTVWNKAAIKGLLDSIDAMFAEGTWSPSDASGAGLTLSPQGPQTYHRLNRIIVLTVGVLYPTTSNGAAAVIGGLPFPVAQNSGGAAWGYITVGGSLPTILPTVNTQNMGIWNSAGAAVPNSGVSGKLLTGIVVYVAN